MRSIPRDSFAKWTTAAEAMANQSVARAGSPRDIKVAGRTSERKISSSVLRDRKSKPPPFIGHLRSSKRSGDGPPIHSKFIEKDGITTGRGHGDMKEVMPPGYQFPIRLKKRKGYMPDRDLILALTDERRAALFPTVWTGCSGNMRNGRCGILHHLDGGNCKGPKATRLLVACTASEKSLCGFSIESLNPGGHSSVSPGPKPSIT